VTLRGGRKMSDISGTERREEGRKKAVRKGKGKKSATRVL